MLWVLLFQTNAKRAKIIKMWRRSQNEAGQTALQSDECHCAGDEWQDLATNGKKHVMPSMLSSTQSGFLEIIAHLRLQISGWHDAMKQSEIKFVVTLDDNKMPERIDWSASDVQKESTCKAVMISLWDTNEKNTLRIDLWTKDMMVDEMKQFYHQNLVSMADTMERATGEKETAKAMRNFAREFGERLSLLKKI
jgi:gliding motility-associated protein GldC